MIVHEYFVRMRNEELLAEAERRRLIKEFRQRPPWFNTNFARSLTWLENLMCRWGSLLARRFGEETAINLSGSIEDSVYDPYQS